MNDEASTVVETAGSDQLLVLYDSTMPAIHRYFMRRCRNRAVAEDLTTEVFLGAASSIRHGAVDTVTAAWLMGIARHKLVDHWRSVERDRRRIDALTTEIQEVDEPWTATLDALAAADVLAELGAHHRSALTLRYIDDLPVAEVATLLDRTLHATEALLVRARRAFRDRYEEVTT